MFIKINNDGSKEYPYSLSNLTKDYPNTSFPDMNTLYQNDELLKAFNVFRVIDQPIPEYDRTSQTYSELSPELINSVWFRKWQIVNLSDAQKFEIRQNEERVVIDTRNSLLNNSDWTQLPDVNVDKEAWIVYRQQLRDITSQPGYPYVIEWPVQPV